MSFNFPDAPTAGDEFTPPGGPTFVWNPPRWNMKGGAGGATIISGPVNPVAADGKAGDWFVNTTTGQWWGPKSASATWPAIPTFRERLVAARTYFVRTDGSDSSNGGADTAAGAFLTIQKAVDAVQALDLNGFDVTITVRTGTYAPFVVTGPWVGKGTVTVNSIGGDFLIDTTTTNCVRLSDGARLRLYGGSYSSGLLTGASAILVQRNSFLEIWNPVTIRAAGGSCLEVRDESTCIMNANMVVQAGCAQVFMLTGHSTLRFEFNLQFVNSPNFTNAVAWVRDNSALYGPAMNAGSGTVTGKKFICDSGGGISTQNNLSPANFPGSIEGDLLGLGYFDNTFGPGLREKLTNDRTYFVNPTTGNDNNSGLTQGTSLASIQRAVDIVWSNIDTGYWTVIIQLAGVTFNEAVLMPGPHVGMRAVVFNGIANSTIWTSGGRTCYVQRGGRIVLQNLEMRSTGGSTVLAEDNGALIIIGVGMRFGPTTNGPHLWAFGGGKITSRNAYSISGGGQIHWRTDAASLIDITGVTITITAAVTFNQFAFAPANCLISCAGLTFTGAANVTGTRFFVNPGGQIDTNGAGINYLPGTVAGVTQPNGIYS